MPAKSKEKSVDTNAEHDGVLIIGETRRRSDPGRWFVLISHGNIVDSGKFSTNQWNAEIVVTRAQEHGFGRIEVKAKKSDIESVSLGFKKRGIEVRSSPTASPKSILDKIPIAPYLKGFERRISRTRSAKPARTQIATYRGLVDSFDADGYATTLLEDGNGDHTEVRFLTKVLEEDGIRPGTRFTYKIYKTADGAVDYDFIPVKPSKLSASDWDAFAAEARQITSNLPSPIWNETES